ncbi:MAG: protease inhibitor I42 family protein [Methanocorpusculum sp.]|nr:protease inhibitor I42 family protein [Methanocorpusculum sp.]HJJ44705.1 protease inhibitor I42 family protein [Methanocorpusculum sp.]
MKKITPVILAAILIVISCIFIAGCVTTPAEPATPGTDQPAVSIDKENPIYSVTVKTDGCDTFSVGSIFELQLPESPSTGCSWQLVKGEEILYNDFYVPPKSSSGLLEIQPRGDVVDVKPVSLGGEQIDPALLSTTDEPIVGAAGVHYFWFQPSRAGDYTISLKYCQPWEKGETYAVYTQKIHVVDSDEPIADGPKTSYVFDSFILNPAVGETVKIIKAANPTTGYVWNVSGDGLIIENDYEVDNPDPGFAGSPGKYMWYVTAAKPGDYILKAEYKHAGSDEILSTFEVPLKFVEAEEPAAQPADDVAYTVNVHLAGDTTYSAGSIFCITLPSNPTTGYDWQVINGKEILRGGEAIYVPDAAPEGIYGVGGVDQFWFTPEKPGDYKITLKYMRSWEGEDKAAAVFSQTIHVVEDKDPYQVNGPKTTYKYDSFNINPAAGEQVKIVVDKQLKKDGCSWTAADTNGLIIANYGDNPAVWLVTANKPGDYLFKAEYKKEGDKTAVSSVEIPLKFV